MNNKVKFILTVAVSLLLLTTFVMGNSLVAHDYLHGRGDAATLAVRWAVVIAIPLANVIWLPYCPPPFLRLGQCPRLCL